MFPVIPEHVEPPEGQVHRFPDYERPDHVPLAELIIRDEFPFDSPEEGPPRLVTSGIKWWQDGNMYGFWQEGHDLRRLAWRWWLGMVMLDHPLLFVPVTRIVNGIRGMHDRIFAIARRGFRL